VSFISLVRSPRGIKAYEQSSLRGRRLKGKGKGIRETPATQAMNKEEKSLKAGAEDESKMEEKGYCEETKNEIWIWFSRQPRTNFFLMISFVIKSVSVISKQGALQHFTTKIADLNRTTSLPISSLSHQEGR